MTQAQATQKAHNLLACIQQGLYLHDQQSTDTHLGDRTQYVGLSDIGRTLECPRAALCNKLFTRPTPSLQTLLTLQRGHWSEYGIGQALNAQGLHIMPQLELAFSHNDVPIKAHFDFVLAWEKPHPAIRILELKSTQHIPDMLYASYEMQLYGQVSLLEQYWNERVFCLRNTDGTLAYEKRSLPELCQALFNLKLPTQADRVDIEGWVLCLSMTNAKAFGPYQANTSMRELCLKTAHELWNDKQAVETGSKAYNDVAYATGFHALCGYCDWNSDCPKFHDGEHQPEWEEALQSLAKLKEQRSHLDAEIHNIEQGMKEAYALSAIENTWINTGTYRFKVNRQKGRRTLNKDAVFQILQKHYGQEADTVLADCEQEGAPTARLYTQNIHK